jgi:hypothetical protein
MSQLIKEAKRMQLLAGLITESQLNEDNTQIKKIARDLYSWLKKNGVEVKLIASLPSAGASGKQIGATSTGNNTSLVWYWDDPKTKQTQIEIHLIGDPKIVADVEKKFLSAYPNLEQYQKTGEGGTRIAFRVREKTTKKGGYVSNTQQNTKPAAQPQQESIEQAVNEALRKFRKKQLNENSLRGHGFIVLQKNLDLSKEKEEEFKKEVPEIYVYRWDGEDPMTGYPSSQTQIYDKTPPNAGGKTGEELKAIAEKLGLKISQAGESK